MISIIIPTYNDHEKLEKALKSIQEQTYTDVEVVVVDDGSKQPLTDTDLYADKRGYIAQLFNIKHAGANTARNYGFHKSHGEYIIFWDADVAGKPEMLEKMLTTLKKYPESSYVYSSHYFGFKKFPCFEFSAKRLKKMNYIHTTSLIRREHLPRFSASAQGDGGPWDLNIKRLQDWDLWLTMLEQGHMGIYIPEYLFKVQPGGTMSSWLPKYAYYKPFKYLLPKSLKEKVASCEHAVDVIKKKHHLL